MHLFSIAATMLLACIIISTNAKYVLDVSKPVTLVPDWRGANYIRLSACVGCPGAHHSTFSPLSWLNNVQPMAAAALAQMGANKYSLVRVFIDQGDGTRNDSVAGNPATDQLGAAYLDNAAAFVTMAAANGVGVMFTFNALPVNAFFNSLVSTSCLLYYMYRRVPLEVFTLWISVLRMRSQAWLAAPVLLAHAEVTENI